MGTKLMISVIKGIYELYLVIYKRQTTGKDKQVAWQVCEDELGSMTEEAFTLWCILRRIGDIL